MWSAALVSIEDAMDICQANKFGDLVAYLHVRAGNHLEAMKVFVSHVDKLISKFLKYDTESDMVSVGVTSANGQQQQSVSHEVVFPRTFEEIERQVNKCASLLREMIVTHHVTEKEVQNAWFALLDAVVTPVKCRQTEAVTSAQFKDLLFALLNSMIGYISLPSITKKMNHRHLCEDDLVPVLKQLQTRTWNLRLHVLNLIRDLIDRQICPFYSRYILGKESPNPVGFVIFPIR